MYRPTESNIDALAWSEDGNIVAVGEENGCLHFIDANTQRPFLSKVCINSNFGLFVSFKRMLLTEMQTGIGLTKRLIFGRTFF